MAAKNLIIHFGWAVAAGAAFMIGSKTNAPSAAEKAAAEQAAAAKATSRSGGGAEFRSDRPDGAASTGRMGEAGGGQISKLFGAYSLDGTNLAAVAEQAVRDANPLTRRLAFAKLLENMSAENAMDIREQLVSLGAEGETWNEFNYAWGALAGKEAFEFARSSDEPDLGAALTGWAAADPAGAMAMLDNLPEEMEGQRQSLQGNIVAGIADTDLDLATTVALQFGEGDDRHAGRLIRNVANEALRAGGPEMASQWVDGLPAGSAKGSAMRRVTESYVRQDPQAAAAWAEQFADQDFSRSAIAEIGDEWAESDPQATMAWLESLPAGSSQNAGFSEALGEWEDRDPQAAGEYLMAMDPSPQRDAAVAGFARGYAWQDPNTALAWAQDISDQGLRERSITDVGRAYFRRDPQAALNWMESSGVSDEMRQRIMNGR